MSPQPSQPQSQSEPPLFKSPPPISNKLVDTIYNSVAISVSRYFDDTHWDQPQGRRIMFLVKEGIENAIGGINIPDLPDRPDPPNPAPPNLSHIYALAILLLLITPAQAASMMGYSLGGSPIMAITQSQVIDIMYNAVTAAISKHFDSTSRTSPQGLKLFFLIKEGLVNGTTILAGIVPIQPGARTDPIPVKGEIPDAETAIETRSGKSEETFAAPI